MSTRQQKVLSVPANRFNLGLGDTRSIPNTGSITATMIKTEWSHNGTFRLSADGASFIDKTPSTNIKYSDFRGKSAITGNPGPNITVCGSGSGGSFSTNAWSGVSFNCGGSTTGGTYCGGNNYGSDSTWRENNSEAAVSLGACCPNSTSTKTNSCSYLPVDELAPGKWRLHYYYDVMVPASKDQYQIRYRQVKVTIRANANKVTSGGGTQLASKTHKAQGYCQYEDWAPDKVCYGDFKSGNSTLDFTVTKGNQWIIIDYQFLTNEYRSAWCKVNNQRLQKIG